MDPTPEFGSYEVYLVKKIDTTDNSTGLTTTTFENILLEKELCGNSFNYSN
jgi:hypothetical protein